MGGRRVCLPAFSSCRDGGVGCGVPAQPLISYTLIYDTSTCHDLYIYDPHPFFLYHELCRIWFSVCTHCVNFWNSGPSAQIARSSFSYEITFQSQSWVLGPVLLFQWMKIGERMGGWWQVELLGLNTGQQRYCTKKLGLATLFHSTSNAITPGQQQ